MVLVPFAHYDSSVTHHPPSLTRWLGLAGAGILLCAGFSKVAHLNDFHESLLHLGLALIPAAIATYMVTAAEVTLAVTIAFRIHLYESALLTAILGIIYTCLSFWRLFQAGGAPCNCLSGVFTDVLRSHPGLEIALSAVLMIGALAILRECAIGRFPRQEMRK